MASKTIAITEDVYFALESRKREGESFTEVIRRLLKKKGKLSDFAGAWADMTDEEYEAIQKAREELRANWKVRDIM
jgi:predicted CopG family antitoxin